MQKESLCAKTNKMSILIIIFIGFLLIMICYGVVKQEHKDKMEETSITSTVSEIYYYKEEIETFWEDMLEKKLHSTISKKMKKDISLHNNDGQDSNECELPQIPTRVKFFTDYRCYNLWYTPHYRMQQMAWTDSQGLRRYNDDYIVALGSFYSIDIGDRFEVTLDTGTKFTVILGDGKVDVDCDNRNMYTPCLDYNGNESANMLEFIVDEKALDPEIYDYGSLDLIDNFKGNVVKMVYLGRDTSADWNTYELK